MSRVGPFLRPGARPGVAAFLLGLLLSALLAFGQSAETPEVGASTAGDPTLDAAVLAATLAGLGPRVPGTPALEEARSRLLEAMRQAGLSEVQELTANGGGVVNLSGVLPGASGFEVVLAAHYDTVQKSPGAVDDAAGCAVVLAAVSRLAAVPRHHSVRVVLFDGEERDLAGSRAWIEKMGEDEHRRILALVNVDSVGWVAAGGGDEGGVVALSLAQPGSVLRLPPAWLVHAAVRASAAVGSPLSVGATTFGGVAQLLARMFSSTDVSDAEPVLAAGVPALTLSDSGLFVTDPMRHTERDLPSRLDAAALGVWSTRLTAITRRLDALSGRPRHDDQFLGVGARVLSRRDLYWICLAVWVALVFAGLPGTWRGRTSAERSRRGRSYLPGFTFRLIFLAAILMLPVFTTFLLLPAAVLCIVATLRRLPWRPAVAIACLPWLVLLAGMAHVGGQGRLGGLALGLPALVLLLSSFGSMVWMLALAQNSAARAASVSTAE